MFGKRRSPKTASLDWPSLLSLLEDDDQLAAVKEQFPGETSESFLAALRRIDSKAANDLLAAGRQLNTASQLIDRPTVAVAGMLNSGKTSLVATFLSDQGRRRSLRGTNNSEGTHRFVLWLPEAWKQDLEVWGLLMSRLKDSLGEAPEMLAEDPLIAHQQYNNRGGDATTLAVPLVATDPQLDAVGIGLLDCPDIVSDAEFGLGSPEARRALLGRASTLCSAFLVVTGAEASRDATLGDLLRIAADLMPGVPRLLAVNKVRPRQTPDQVRETFEPLARNHGIETVFAAYDFDVPASRPFIPRFDEAGENTSENYDSMPVFFSVAKNPDENPPAAITPDRLLQSLPQRLDRGQLFDKFRIALESGLRSAVWDVGYSKLTSSVQQTHAQTTRAQQMMLNVALEFFAHRDDITDEILELRLLHSKRIIQQLAEAFAENAPWYAKFSVRLHTTVRRIVGGATDLMRQLTPTALAQRTATDLKEKFSRGEHGTILSPDRLRKAIERHGGIDTLPNWRDDKNLEPTCDEAIMRFDRSDVSSLDPRRLNAAVQEMWREVPIRKKLAAGLTPLAAMLAAFGGALMIPVDFGTSFIASASISELLAATGLAAFAAMWAGGQNTRHVGQQAAKQQLATFHAVLCDTFGFARPSDETVIMVEKQQQVLPSAKVAPFDSLGEPLKLYVVRDEFSRELQRQIPRGGGDPA